MEFLYPGFLYALAALAIPVIVHLFNFRRFRKIPFTNVRFLREVKSRTQSQNRLRHLLVLISRLLVLAFLVLAFAQPYVPTGDAREVDHRRAVSVFIDNSFSMEGETEEGTLLDVAKNRAIDIAMAFEPTDKFQVLTHDFSGRHGYFVSRSEFIDLVQEIDYSPHSRSFEQIVARQKDHLRGSARDAEWKAYVVSDFQKSRFDPTTLTPDSTVSIDLVHLRRTSPANLFVDSVWFANPVRKSGQAERLMVRVANTGDEDVENVPLQLAVNGVQRAIGSAAIAAQSTADTVLHFIHETPGLKNAVISVDDYPVTYDDTYYFGYEVFEYIEVLEIRPDPFTGPDYFRGIFQSDSAYRYHAVPLSSVEYATIPSYDFVILNGLPSVPGGLGAKLEEQVKNGGSLWVIPGEDIELESYNTFLTGLGGGAITGKVEATNEVNRINVDNPVYLGIFESIPRNPDLPKTTEYYRISSPVDGSGDPLLILRGGDPFLEAYPSGSGRVYLTAVSLDADKNNFARHGLFVAGALRMAEMSRATSLYAYTLGEERPISLPASSIGEAVAHLVSTDSNLDVIPYQRNATGRLEIDPGPDLNTAGNFHLIAGEDTLLALGLNYNRLESDLDSYTTAELGESISQVPGLAISVIDGNTESLTSEVKRLRTGTELWKYCLILALIFLMAETLLLRLGKKQTA